MIKLVFCLSRRPALSWDEFQEYWSKKHAPLVARHAETLGNRRYRQSRTFENPYLSSLASARGIGMANSYDGVAELWFDSEETVLAVGQNASARAAGRELIEDERQFIDLPYSSLFFAKEAEIAVSSGPFRYV
jgi:uncharacterized protein (TIGR02118 family)